MNSFSLPKHLANARILISNDDGIHAQGLNILETIAREFSDDVWVVAPETEQSGAGHSLTLHQPLRVRKISNRHFAVTGTPTDCVLLAAQELVPQDKPIDLVLSGINHGDNLAEHVTYSGTIAATMEGTILGYPSIAFSQILGEGAPNWNCAAEATRRVLKQVSTLSWSANTLLSVNIPDCSIEALQPIAITKQGKRCTYGTLKTEARRDPRDKAYYWVAGVSYEDSKHDADTDCAATAKNHISLTPISMDLTNYDAMTSLASQCKSTTNDAAA